MVLGAFQSEQPKKKNVFQGQKRFFSALIFFFSFSIRYIERKIFENFNGKSHVVGKFTDR